MVNKIINKVSKDAIKSIAALVYLPDLDKPYWSNALAVDTEFIMIITI
jgi:hypothetical protein